MALKTQGSFFETTDDTDVSSPYAFAHLEEVNSITGPDGKAKLIDTTHLASLGKEYLQGIPDFGQVALDCNFTGAKMQEQLRKRYSNQATKKRCRIRIPDDATAFHHVFEFDAIVTSWNLDVKTDDKTGLKITVQVVGGVNYFPPAASPG